MRRKQREFGAFSGASVLPISRTLSGASRASPHPACPSQSRISGRGFHREHTPCWRRRNQCNGRFKKAARAGRFQKPCRAEAVRPPRCGVQNRQPRQSRGYGGADPCGDHGADGGLLFQGQGSAGASLLHLQPRQGARSGLFMEQMRIVREMRLAEKARGREGVNIRPRWMCWENVPGAFSSGTPKYEDFRIVMEEIVRICFPNELIPSPYPYGWPDAGELTAGGAFSLAWRCLDAQFWGVAQRRKRIFLLADFAGPLAPQLLFDVFGETGNCGKEVT